MAQPVPLPNTYDSFLRIGNIDAQVLLEAHVDLLCPDCAAAEPALEQVVQYYGPTKLQLVYHLFPLPYHTWAFTTALGGNIIRQLNGTDAAVAAWKDYMFAGGQQNFWNAQLSNLTNDQVNQLFATTANQVTGVSATAFLDQLNNNAGKQQYAGRSERNKFV
jgi:predicted DsbA family dithiol-disulfide isomerase